MQYVDTSPPSLLTLHHYDGHTAKVSFRTFNPNIMLRILLLPIIGLWLLTIGFIGISAQGDNFLLALLFIILFISTPFIVIRVYFPRIYIKIDSSKITIGKSSYERKLWGGFRPLPQSVLGFQYHGNLKSTRFQLGSGAKDTYLDQEEVLSIDAIVIWLNDLVDDTGVSNVLASAFDNGSRDFKF
ncbi:hypothetical protein [Dinoroseobacter sp. S76]|uniref:hypothetical protein n=1 Tax=Dinoroseobacter sp. S76 TaxID=3415124 RepID=UPI003C7C6CFE